MLHGQICFDQPNLSDAITAVNATLERLGTALVQTVLVAPRPRAEGGVKGVEARLLVRVGTGECNDERVPRVHGEHVARPHLDGGALPSATRLVA
jgi:hypothetical protein